MSSVMKIKALGGGEFAADFSPSLSFEGSEFAAWVCGCGAESEPAAGGDTDAVCRVCL